MSNGNTQESLKELLSAMEEFITTKTVVGDPIQIGETVVLPLVDVQFGAGVGGKVKKAESSPAGKSEAGGIGAKMSPSALLVIKNGSTRLVNIKQQDTLTKVIDMVPDLIDKLLGTNKEEDEVIFEKMREQEESKGQADQ